MSASNPAPEPTEIAGRFQVVQKLGAGAFGTVYKARDKVLGRMLAIKTIRMEGLAASQAGLAEMLERFKREAQVAAQLKHPGIVTIYDIGEADGLSYISMELIDGVGLDHVIAESGRLPVERAAALAAQVADALDFAHRHGVVHRDIKPANIMIEAGDRVKVTDFGIAKPTESAEHLTLTGSLLGTPSYMSPEQARGTALDGRSDLFALGCVLYEMVTGRKAFRGESITALLFKIITEEPQPLRELDPSLPERLGQIIAKAISKAPETRYQTGRELADDLLTLAKPGALPTLRALETPTLPVAPDVSSSAATLPRPAGPPPLPPTIRTPPPTAVRPATVRNATPRPATPAPAVAPAAPARRGRGLALLLGLGAVAVLVLAALAVAAWAFLVRRPAGPAAAVLASPPPATLASPAPAAEAGTPPEAPVATASALPTTLEGTPPPAPPSSETRAATPVAPTHARAAATPEPPPSAVASSGSAATGGDTSFLDEVPTETTDGRTQGEALAQKYRSGGSGGISGTRFTRRSRFPPRIALPERGAVGTLAHLLSAEEAYQRANGSYGSLQDLARAGFLRLDVPIAAGAFQRARYRFQLSGGGGEFRATATPLAAGRPFVVDQSGYIRVDE